MKSYGLDELLTRRAEGDQPYLEFLRVESMSAGIYVLGPEDEDKQGPHRQDELYFVVEGEGQIAMAGEESSVEPGTAIFVAANVPHRFHSITRKLVVLVFFAPPESA